jgi:hypothetical protein
MLLIAAGSLCYRHAAREVYMKTLLCLGAMFFAVKAFGQDKFEMTCHPFKDIEAHHPIDASCGLAGKPSTDGSKSQNTVKDNFCAGDSFGNITVEELTAKQKDVANLDGYSGWHRDTLPSDRGPFAKLGEGKAVSFTGYIFEAHNADLTSGESVNCNVPKDVASNDIHIALVEQGGETDECQSVTAEMIPHYRPSSWTKTALARLGKTTLVRVSGQLMFDGSHKVCDDPKRANTDPKRVSDWEIHPVYKFEVCVKRSGDRCSSWQDFSDWAAKKSAPKKSKRQ